MKNVISMIAVLALTFSASAAFANNGVHDNGHGGWYNDQGQNCDQNGNPIRGHGHGNGNGGSGSGSGSGTGTGGSSSSSSTNSNTSTNTNQNVNANSNSNNNTNTATGGSASSNSSSTQGQKQSINNSGNSSSTSQGGSATIASGAVSNTVSANGNGSGNSLSTGASTSGAAANGNGDGSNNTTVSSTYVAAKIPVSTAYAPSLTSGADTCLGSVSAGAQTGVLGLSFGSTKVDDNCIKIKRTHLITEFSREAGCQYMLDHIPDAAAAFAKVGAKCVNDVVVSIAAPTIAAEPVVVPLPVESVAVPFVTPAPKVHE